MGPCCYECLSPFPGRIESLSTVSRVSPATSGLGGGCLGRRGDGDAGIDRDADFLGVGAVKGDDDKTSETPLPRLRSDGEGDGGASSRGEPRGGQFSFQFRCSGLDGAERNVVFSIVYQFDLACYGFFRDHLVKTDPIGPGDDFLLDDTAQMKLDYGMIGIVAVEIDGFNHFAKKAGTAESTLKLPRCAGGEGCRAEHGRRATAGVTNLFDNQGRAAAVAEAENVGSLFAAENLAEIVAGLFNRDSGEGFGCFSPDRPGA